MASCAVQLKLDCKADWLLDPPVKLACPPRRCLCVGGILVEVAIAHHGRHCEWSNCEEESMHGGAGRHLHVQAGVPFADLHTVELVLDPVGKKRLVLLADVARLPPLVHERTAKHPQVGDQPLAHVWWQLER